MTAFALARASTRRAPAASIEALEPRRLLSAVVYDNPLGHVRFVIEDGVLTIERKNEADEAADEHMVVGMEYYARTDTYQMIAGWGIGPTGVRSAVSFLMADHPDFKGVRFDGGGGDDRLSVNQTFGYGPFPFGVTLLGGAGDDVLLGGSSDDMLIGGAGSDRVHGRAGADHLEGEQGWTPHDDWSDSRFFKPWDYSRTEGEMWGDMYRDNPLESDPADVWVNGPTAATPAVEPEPEPVTRPEPVAAEAGGGREVAAAPVVAPTPFGVAAVSAGAVWVGDDEVGAVLA